MAYFGAVGLSSTLLPGVLWSQVQQQGTEITKEMIAGAEEISGLKFSDEERTAMVRSLQSMRGNLQQLHKEPLDQSILPAIVFDPVPPGKELAKKNKALMVRKDLVDSGRYKSFADLKGMKVAIGAPGTGTASALNEALKKGGLKYSDVDVVYIGFPEHLPTYKNKGIDASITNEPTMTRAIEDGVAVRVAGNDITYPDQQTAVTFYADNFIRNRRDVAERFMRAYLRGVRMYNDALKDGRLAGPKANEVIPILVKYTTIKDESMFRRMVPSYCNPDGEVNVTSLKKDLEFFRELGLIEKKDASVDGVVDSSFAKAAVAKLGPYRAQAN